MLAAVQQDGHALEYASAELNADHEVLIVIQGIRKMAAALRNQAVLAAAWLATLQVTNTLYTTWNAAACVPRPCRKAH